MSISFFSLRPFSEDGFIREEKWEGKTVRIHPTKEENEHQSCKQHKQNAEKNEQIPHNETNTHGP